MADDLTQEERQVLGVLMQPDRGIADLTVDRIAKDLGMESLAVARTLDGLEAEGVVKNSTDATLEVEFWIALNEAAERLDSPDAIGA
jgi:DNA-binding MarR family transcriptional regulator